MKEKEVESEETQAPEEKEGYDEVTAFLLKNSYNNKKQIEEGIF